MYIRTRCGVAGHKNCFMVESGNIFQWLYAGVSLDKLGLGLLVVGSFILSFLFMV